MEQLKNDKTKVCIKCDRTFTRKNNAQIYCSLCAKYKSLERLRKCLYCERYVLVYADKEDNKCHLCGIKLYQKERDDYYNALTEKQKTKLLNRRALELLNEK